MEDLTCFPSFSNFNQNRGGRPPAAVSCERGAIPPSNSLWAPFEAFFLEIALPFMPGSASADDLTVRATQAIDRATFDHT